MDNTQKWINEFNNFKAIYTEQPKEDVLFHSGNLKALNGICLHQYDTDTGKTINEFPSLQEAQRQLNISHIWDCIHGRRNMAGGYKWKYAETS